SYLIFVVSADVVNGAAEANSLPGFVKNKEGLFENLKGLCYRHHKTRVIAKVNLPGCSVTCATGVFSGIFGSGSTVSLRDNEPCDSTGVSFSVKLNMNGEMLYEL
ncbi:unnamed protein product, partial [Ixodes persulcatus]